MYNHFSCQSDTSEGTTGIFTKTIKSITNFVREFQELLSQSEKVKITKIKVRKAWSKRGSYA